MSSSNPGQLLLVVDDEHTVRELLVRALSRPAIAVSRQRARTQPPSWCHEILRTWCCWDIRMPRKSGIDLLRELVGEYPDVAVLMVTAANDVRTAVNAMKLGAYDFVTKPFDLDDLLALVRMALEQRHLRMPEGRHDAHTHRKVKELTEQSRSQFRDLVGSLAREHELRVNLDSAPRPKQRKGLRFFRRSVRLDID